MEGENQEHIDDVVDEVFAGEESAEAQDDFDESLDNPVGELCAAFKYDVYRFCEVAYELIGRYA